MTDAGDEPFAIERSNGTAPVVFVVDHASNHIPAPYGDLGLDAAARDSHIAWDPGALPVAQHMSRMLDAPLIRATVSRLVLDLNRSVESDTLVPQISETTTIPGNKNLSPAERGARIDAVYRPYHAAVENLVVQHAAKFAFPIAVVAIHTFTPVYKGLARPWHVGILFDEDDSLGRAILGSLAADLGMTSAANQPYSPADGVYWTLDRHAAARGLKNVMIEIRNDEVRTEDAQTKWATKLAGPIARMMGMTGQA